MVFFCFVMLFFSVSSKQKQLHTSIDRVRALNLLSELSRLFCDISPLRGIAMKPRFRRIKASFRVPWQVELKMMNELPAISLIRWTKYTSLNLKGMKR